MRNQVKFIEKSCNFQLRSTDKTRQCLSSDAASNFIHAFISNKLDYGNSLIYGLTDNDIQRLQNVQNNVARILTNARNYDHISSYTERTSFDDHKA